MSEINNVSSVLNQFGGTPLETAKDEGLLSVANCRQRVLDAIQVNISNYKNNSWDRGNQMQKLLIDTGKNKNSIFSLRIGGKRIYRCSCVVPTTDLKINFLSQMHDVVAHQGLDKPIIDFCEREVQSAQRRKAAQRARARQRRKEKAFYNTNQQTAQATKNTESTMVTSTVAVG